MMHENEKKEYTTEELLAQIEIMKKTIKLQHITINRLMDTYVLKSNAGKHNISNNQTTK